MNIAPVPEFLDERPPKPRVVDAGRQLAAIVPERSRRAGAGASGVNALVLPFEGDTTLSVILSKAFMLADDDRIGDPTILQQMRPVVDGPQA